MSDPIVLHAGEYIISTSSAATLEALQQINGEKP